MTDTDQSTDAVQIETHANGVASLFLSNGSFEVFSLVPPTNSNREWRFNIYPSPHPDDDDTRITVTLPFDGNDALHSVVRTVTEEDDVDIVIGVGDGTETVGIVQLDCANVVPYAKARQPPRAFGSAFTGYVIPQFHRQ